MRLYHHPMSANARRAVMTALHLGADVEIVLVDLAKGAQRQPDFLRMNPNGRVPVLDDDGFLLTESHAIMTYPRRQDPRPDALPGGAPGPRRRRPLALLERAPLRARDRGPQLGEPRQAHARRRPGRPQRAEAGRDVIAQFARVLDAHLAGKEWVAQGRLTLADLALATPLMSTVPARLPVTDYANLQAWFGRVQALDAWKKTGL